MKRDVCVGGPSQIGLGVWFWWAVSTVMILPVSGVWALDQLVTKDGEVLRGKLVSKTDGEIVFRSQTFGELRIPAYNVTLTEDLQEGQPAAGKKNVPLTLNQTPPQIKASTSGGDGKAEEARESVREWLRLPDGMSVNAGLGIGFMSGETVGENMSTSLDINYDTGRYVGSFGGRYRYGTVEGNRVTDDHRIYGGVDRYFGDPKNRKYFAVMKGLYSSDRVHLVDTQFDLFH